MLQIQHRRVADVSILDIEGRITPGVPEQAFVREVAVTVRAGARKLLLNLARATSTDTAGISALVAAYHAVRGAGGRLKLLKVEHRYAQLLAAVALRTCFEMFDSEEAALISFRSPRGGGAGAASYQLCTMVTRARR
jgi:anti-anti-sigma factor